MIVILSGITGAGKSYIKKHIINKLNFKSIVPITTRDRRMNEIQGIDMNFVSEEQFDELKKDGKISACFNFLGNKYGHYTKDLNSFGNSIVELHYSAIDEFKKFAKDVITIYIQPDDIDMAKKQLKLRKLPDTVEKLRLKEMKEQVAKFKNNTYLISKFDYIVSNDYTSNSLEIVTNLIKSLADNCKAGV